jgi:hypothetical protein
MPRAKSNPRPKTISAEGLLGQKGINLIEKVVLEMQSLWTPSGPNEVGIDGYIELFDPVSRVALGKTLAVQSKALSNFTNEIDESFDYWCDRRDLNYWLQGNMPVIVIVSRPASDEAYWVCVKDYFADNKARSSTKIHFSKGMQRFTRQSLRELADLGRSPEIGLYLAPVPRLERLHSNLIPLIDHPPRIYIASTVYRLPREVWAAFRREGLNADGAWVLRDKHILAFHDLNESPWNSVCDPGTIEEFDTIEWSDSVDGDRRRQFVQLLNRTLSTQLGPEVRYWPKEDCYAFVGRLDEGTSKRSYKSLKRQSPLSVVSKFESKSSEGRTFEWLRHLGFRGQFRRLNGQWYLEITPTYRFTSDGNWLYRYHEDALKGIKRLEGNRAVLSAVLFWADYLNPEENLFREANIPLQFGKLLHFELEGGINDTQWSARDPNPPSDDASNGEELFLPNFNDEFDS